MQKMGHCYGFISWFAVDCQWRSSVWVEVIVLFVWKWLDWAFSQWTLCLVTCNLSYFVSNVCVCVCVLQVYDVFTGEVLSLPSHTTPFTVSINPSGVVMWYVYPVTHHKLTEGAGRYPNVRRKYRISSLKHRQPKGEHHFFIWERNRFQFSFLHEESYLCYA